VKEHVAILIVTGAMILSAQARIGETDAQIRARYQGIMATVHTNAVGPCDKEIHYSVPGRPGVKQVFEVGFIGGVSVWESHVVTTDEIHDLLRANGILGEYEPENPRGGARKPPSAGATPPGTQILRGLAKHVTAEVYGGGNSIHVTIYTDGWKKASDKLEAERKKNRF
jgi:hypothetical protein